MVTNGTGGPCCAQHSSGLLSPFAPRDVGDVLGTDQFGFVCCLTSIFWMFEKMFWDALDPRDRVSGAVGGGGD